FFITNIRRHSRAAREWSSDVCSSDLFWCYSKPRSGVLTIQNREVGLVLMLEGLEVLANNSAAGLSNRVADKKYFHESLRVPMDGLDASRGWAPAVPAGYCWDPREACGAHLFEPGYTGGRPIHALGDLGTREG